MKFVYSFLVLLFCCSNYVYSQQISVDDSVPLQQLIEDNLIQNSCVEITNITSSVNGSVSGLTSYAYFNRGSSNFPFENGIMLSTGDASSGGNGLITPILSEGSTIWGTDPDIEAALGISNTLNATSIEFDIISISNQIQFNYLLASEEYFGANPCQLSDGFAFLIKETGSPAPYQNIALVPGTSIPVNTNTIHNEIYGNNGVPICVAQNDQYFDGYAIGDTNYNGRTNVLTASATITPYVQYHIKLIIADQTDGSYDSAVFIEGNSFKILDLGEDISTCESSVNLNADIQNPLATYAWFLDNNPIAGSGSIFNATQSGTYRVEVTVPLNSNDCTEEDEIVVTLNIEETINPVTNYILCDDLTEDGIESFNLSTKDAEVISSIPFPNTFSYHLSDADARNNIGSITTPIFNTSNPQPIFVRVQNLDTGCYGYTTFNLVVSTIPSIVTPGDLEVCDSDDDPNGITLIDLPQKDNEITSGQSNLNVTYHYTPADANTGNNPIPTPYLNINPIETVYVRVEDDMGCYNTTTLTVNVTISPIVNRNTQYIDACDNDDDGFATFDLTQVITDILAGLTGVTTTFHTSLIDAESGDNPIADAANYENISPDEQVIFVRIVDENTGCASIVPIEIHTNLLLTGTDTGDFALCDNNDDSNDTLEFNLNTVENYIADNLPNIDVTFYATQSDLDNDIGAIDESILYPAVSPTTLFIRIENGNCLVETEIVLLVNPILSFNPTQPEPYCDTDDDGIVSIELATFDNTVTGGNTDFIVSYFANPIDAENNLDGTQLPPFYTNTLSIETLYARIEHRDTGCHTVNPFDIEVIVAPAATAPTPFLICDDDGFSVINLEDKIIEIVPDITGLNIDFFTSFDDANTNTDVITDRTTYNANTQTIFVRVESITSGCYNIVSFDITVNTIPIISPIDPFQVCVDDNSNLADFLLIDKDAEILDGQTGKEVFYFADENDAIIGNYINAIDKNNPYQNIASSQPIYVRVENITDPNCFETSSFTLQVSSDPIYNPIIDYLICDDITNDEVHIFDLEEKRTEISQGSSDNLNITFHLTPQEAEDNINDVTATTSLYENAQNPQTLYIRIESSDSFCYVIEELGINIIASPDITQVSAPLEQCDADYNGFTIFNLEDADFEIRDRFLTDLIINYFESLDDINPNDGLDNSSEIPNPTSYLSNTRTVFIKVANIITGCYSVIPLELVVNLPPTTNSIGTIPICDNDTDTFDLSQVDTMLVDDTTNISITYYDTLNDANNDNTVAALNNTYNYTSALTPIYARVVDTTVGCPITIPFNLQVNPNPIANTPPDLTDCDDDFDGFLEFDLSVNNDDIFGAQNPSVFTITYYNDLTNAQEANNSLDDLYLATDGEIIYARIENNFTGCFNTTQFTTWVNPLPVIPIEDAVPLCVNDLPLIISADTGNVGDTYLWSTGETTTEIQLGLDDLGDHLVTVTTPEGCDYPKYFSVIESEEATINFTTTVDFADPNSITVDVSGIGNYVYILDDGEPQTSNVFENVTFGLHLVTIRDLNGCNDVSKEVIVIDVPKFVTPNDDGDFDTWHIIGIEQLPGTIVYIYNRQGKLLKTLPHTSIGWDGTYRGENMPSDDYWFVANVKKDGIDFDVKGHFALKR